jgi:hypothetical protein
MIPEESKELEDVTLESSDDRVHDELDTTRDEELSSRTLEDEISSSGKSRGELLPSSPQAARKKNTAT